MSDSFSLISILVLTGSVLTLVAVAIAVLRRSKTEPDQPGTMPRRTRRAAQVLLGVLICGGVALFALASAWAPQDSFQVTLGLTAPSAEFYQGDQYLGISKVEVDLIPGVNDFALGDNTQDLRTLNMSEVAAAAIEYLGDAATVTKVTLRAMTGTSTRGTQIYDLQLRRSDRSIDSLMLVAYTTDSRRIRGLLVRARAPGKVLAGTSVSVSLSAQLTPWTLFGSTKHRTRVTLSLGLVPRDKAETYWLDRFPAGARRLDVP